MNLGSHVVCTALYHTHNGSVTSCLMLGRRVLVSTRRLVSEGYDPRGAGSRRSHELTHPVLLTPQAVQGRRSAELQAGKRKEGRGPRG